MGHSPRSKRRSSIWRRSVDRRSILRTNSDLAGVVKEGECRQRRTSARSSVEKVLPVGWHLTRRARGWLTGWMRLRVSKRRSLVVVVGRVVPEPLFTWLETPNDSVPGMSCVGAGMLTWRSVAAADATAFRAASQVKPPSVGFEAVGASVATGRNARIDAVIQHGPRIYSHGRGLRRPSSRCSRLRVRQPAHRTTGRARAAPGASEPDPPAPGLAFGPR